MAQPTQVVEDRAKALHLKLTNQIPGSREWDALPDTEKAIWRRLIRDLDQKVWGSSNHGLVQRGEILQSVSAPDLSKERWVYLRDLLEEQQEGDEPDWIDKEIADEIQRFLSAICDHVWIKVDQFDDMLCAECGIAKSVLPEEAS